MVRTRNSTAAVRRQREKLLAVQAKTRSSKTPQFFKVIFGKDCSSALFLPPKFVLEVKLAKQIQLQDFSGQLWPVTLHRYDGGSLALRKGWHKFFIDHGLEEGHFLLFTYIQEDHFGVQVFDRTACEKFDFKGVKPPQGKRPQKDLDLRDGLRSDSSIASDAGIQDTEKYQTAGNGSLDRLQVTPTPMDTDDLSCMINRDYRLQEENRNWLFDLSNFETVNVTEHEDKNEKATDTTATINNAGTNEGDTQMPALDPNRVESSGDPSMDEPNEDLDTTVVIQHQKKGFKGQVAVKHANKIFTRKTKNVSDSKASSTEVTKGGGTQAAIPCIDPVNDHSRDALIDNIHAEPLARGNSGKDVAGHDHSQNFNKASPRVGKVKVARRASGRGDRSLEPLISKTVKPRSKKEAVEPNKVPACSCDTGLVLSAKRKHTPILSPGVKIEPDLEWEAGSPDVLPSFTAEVKSYSWLELPVHIPSAPGQRESGGRKIVRLKDSSGRVWPLMYADAFPLKALTKNWSTFCELNNIKAGDKCRFRFDNQMGVYQVEVGH